MEIHKTAERYSLNGTRAELEQLTERLTTSLAGMRKREEEIAAARPDAREPHDHSIDFGLDEVSTLKEIDNE